MKFLIKIINELFCYNNRKTKKKAKVPVDWYSAFELFRDYIETLPIDEKQVIFFDEMPWLDNQKSEFLPAFEWFWNDWLSTRSNLIFIVCGSATAWMDEKIVNNKGGLFNRHTCRLYLLPFQLCDVEAFFYWYNAIGLRKNKKRTTTT